MAPVALSRLLSLAAVAVSYAAAQTTPTPTGSSSAPASSPTTAPTPTDTGLPPGVTGTFPSTPLASMHFTYPSGVPYQVENQPGLIRGVQSGYNICNSTTENQESLCQTAFFNDITDFCLWGPPVSNGFVADYEAQMVAYCTKPGRGTRLIPAGALQGVQWITTPAYLQVTGFIDQTMIDMNSTDYGGELDPHGADLRGNPMGGLMFSTAFTSGTWEQVIDWNVFMGGGAFCAKACNPANSNEADFCQNIFDRIGCAYNVPANPQNGTFESCQGDVMMYPGVYVSNGVTLTYTQPPESLGAISTMPYQPSIPASSSCTTYQSASIYAALSTVQASPTASASGSGSGSKTGSASGSQSTGKSNDATALTVSGLSLLGVAFSVLFLS